MILRRLRINVGIALVVFILVTGNIILFGLTSGESPIKVDQKNNILKDNLIVGVIERNLRVPNSDNELDKKLQKSEGDDSKQKKEVQQSDSDTIEEKKVKHPKKRRRTRAS